MPEESTDNTFGGTFGIDKAPSPPTTIYITEDITQEWLIACLASTLGDFSYNHDGTADNYDSQNNKMMRPRRKTNIIKCIAWHKLTSRHYGIVE